MLGSPLVNDFRCAAGRVSVDSGLKLKQQAFVAAEFGQVWVVRVYTVDVIVSYVNFDGLTCGNALDDATVHVDENAVHVVSPLG
jgi:hypothetical protein